MLNLLYTNFRAIKTFNKLKLKSSCRVSKKISNENVWNWGGNIITKKTTLNSIEILESFKSQPKNDILS